jgi:GNAT superfamily N-acetyltransferase
MTRHLLSLGEHDRYLRFGYPASDEHISNYVNGISFDRDAVFGVFDHRLDLMAMMHLANATPDPSGIPGAIAEFGVSVLDHARGRGYGARLFEHAVMYARNRGVKTLIIHALSENTAMLKIARRAGASVERDGPEADATLKLPPTSMATQLSELIEQQVAEADYHFKAHACRVNEVFAVLTAAKFSPRDGLHLVSK